LNLGQKGKLFYLKLSISLPSFEIFGAIEALLSWLSSWNIGKYWKVHWFKRERIIWSQPASLVRPTRQIAPSRQHVRPARTASLQSPPRAVLIHLARALTRADIFHRHHHLLCPSSAWLHCLAPLCSVLLHQEPLKASVESCWGAATPSCTTRKCWIYNGQNHCR
jgi:hypothetical protein